ncbi:acyltransferase family protein [Acidovorax radicis]|uniref:acyltransferase family protein n=1 Tax=Acidovorax radicis TaxID=758826 RepID=UPI001CFAE44D|nr:acyltransferase [Acidovorax radicis]UCU99855.1 acyltransferase [Acidovorax radicis]
MSTSPSTEHHNAFNALRIGAASAVIFSHHFHITGTRPPAWLHSDMVGGVAVMTFFTVSGYLVTLSWLRDPRVLAFVAKRLLRLWPGMLVAILADVLLFGPMFTTLPLREFWTHPATLEHWRNLLLVDAYVNLPGVFPANPLAGLMNGPLWTIPMELMCYGVLAAAGVLGVMRRRVFACLATLGYLAFFLVMRNADLTGTMRHWLEYPAYFACGGLIALFRDVFLLHARRLVLAVIPLAAALFFGAKLEHSAGLLLLPPLLVYWGTRRAPVFSWLHRAGDPSYGIYVLGCPIQQVVQAVCPQLPFLASLSLALILAWSAGYASWHLVEAPALRLKRMLGRAGPPDLPSRVAV